MRVAIIGGGAAGLMCGAILAEAGLNATIFDGNEKLGKKLYITGKGRCNLTNLCEPKEFLDNVVNGKKFLQSAINKFSSFDTYSFFEDNGLKLKLERGQRVFPESDKASDVTKTLEKLNKKNKILLNALVDKVTKQKSGDKIAFIVKTKSGEFEFDKVIVATGGKSYPLTGSTGDGYNIAKAFGHKIVSPKPALTAIELKDKYASEIQGLSLKNVALHAEFLDEKEKSKNANKAESSAKTASLSFQGEMMFTDKGITGPIVLSMSSMINRAKEVKLWLDFKPALSKEQLDNRLLREFEENKNKNISYIIHGLLPKNFVDVFMAKAEILPNKKVNSITKEERIRIIDTLKKFDLNYKNLYPLESGIVTSGGVNLDELNPKSCESKLHKGLYFIGEVIDADALTGGFNIQIALSTAYICACDIIKLQQEGK